MKPRALDCFLFPDKARQKWERLRSQGVWRFIVVEGVLRWGGSMFAITTPLWFVMAWLSPDGMGVGPHSLVGPHRPTLQIVLFDAAAWLTGGLVFGILVWVFSEVFYRRADRAA